MEWISVDDEMPDDLQSVLCWCNDIVNGWYEVLFFDGIQWNDTNGTPYPCIVTHWAEISKPSE